MRNKPACAKDRTVNEAIALVHMGSCAESAERKTVFKCTHTNSRAVTTDLVGLPRQASAPTIIDSIEPY